MISVRLKDLNFEKDFVPEMKWRLPADVTFTPEAMRVFWDDIKIIMNPDLELDKREWSIMVGFVCSYVEVPLELKSGLKTDAHILSELSNGNMLVGL